MAKQATAEQKAKWAEDKAAKTEQAKQLLADGLSKIQSGDDWADLLRTFAVRGRLSPRRYSFQNQMLVSIQAPGASAVATYKAWQRHGRQVRKGEKAIMIFQPVPWKRENSKGQEERGIWFRTLSVFALSQTDGPDLPEPAPLPEITGEEAFPGSVEALRRVVLSLDGIVRDVAIRPRDAGDWHPTAKGWYSKVTKGIVVIEEGSRADQFATLCHEVAHAILHGDEEHHDDKGVKELEAESTAFVVCHVLGIDTSAQSFQYIAHWNHDKDAAKLLGKVGDRVMRAANKILDALLGDEDEEPESEEVAA